jgi:ribA/ribD-fused uncharacterized protein
MWPHVEAAYQASKSHDRSQDAKFATMTGGQAKRAGKTLTLRPDWETIKVDIMYDLVHEKFNQNKDLAAMLIATNDAILVEGNTWGDTVWGACPVGSNKGSNLLGRILMSVRALLNFPHSVSVSDINAAIDAANRFSIGSRLLFDERSIVFANCPDNGVIDISSNGAIWSLAVEKVGKQLHATVL